MPLISILYCPPSSSPRCFHLPIVVCHVHQCYFSGRMASSCVPNQQIFKITAVVVVVVAVAVIAVVVNLHSFKSFLAFQIMLLIDMGCHLGLFCPNFNNPLYILSIKGTIITTVFLGATNICLLFLGLARIHHVITSGSLHTLFQSFSPGNHTSFFLIIWDTCIPRNRNCWV